MTPTAVNEQPAAASVNGSADQTVLLPAAWKIPNLPNLPIVSRLTTAQKNLLGVMRHPENYFNRETRKVNQLYGLAFSASVEVAATRLASGEIQNFDALWQYATDWRTGLAMSNGPGSVAVGQKEFGIRRKSDEENAWTPCKGCYEYVVERLEENLRTKMEGNPVSSHTHVYRIKNCAHPIKMTTVMKLLPGPNIKLPAEHQFAMIHGPASNVPRILEHAQTLAAEYMAIGPRKPAKRMEKLGELHWVLAQAMPNRRGSAACSELVVRALALASNNELPPFKRGFVPDLEAIASPCRLFKAGYSDSFERHRDAT